MPKKWPNLESLLKNEGKAISWRGSNGKIFHLALGNTSNRPQKGAIYNCCLAVYGALSVCLSVRAVVSLRLLSPRVPALMGLYKALWVGRGSVSRNNTGFTPPLLRRAPGELTESHLTANILSGHFPPTKSAPSGGKNVARSRRSNFSSAWPWYE